MSPTTEVGPGVIRCVTIVGGVALLIASIVAGVDGELKLVAFGMLGVGVGVPIGQTLEKKKAGG